MPVDDPDLDTELVVFVEANADGSIRSLKLGETIVSDLELLENRLSRYRSVLSDRALRVRLQAPDLLKYIEAAKLIGACSKAGVSSVKLSGNGQGGP